jgi:hypothetical protein
VPFTVWLKTRVMSCESWVVSFVFFSFCIFSSLFRI